MYKTKNLIEIDLNKYNLDDSLYGACCPALTLGPSDLGHDDFGWYVEGEEIEDYYTWVNDFQAFHEDFGFVIGDFEDEVYASSVEAFEHFIEHHAPDYWDYWDI